MATPEPAALFARARRAYERARLLRAATVAAPLALLPASTALWCAPPPLALGAGLALLLAATVFLWRGQGFGRAVIPGALGVAPALLLPAAAGRVIGHVCRGGSCWDGCVAGCLAAGIVAGVVLWRRAPAAGPDRVRYLVAGVVVACLTGLPACAFAGVFGSAALLVGVAGCTVPALLRPARA